MRIISLFCLLILVGCGKDYNPDLNRPHVNTDLATYVNRFVQVADLLGHPVSLGRIQVNFVNTMEGSAIGKCYSGIMTPRVEVNRSYWERAGVTNSSREQLIFHELGHCLLGRGHRNDESYLYGTFIPLSVMNSYAFGSWKYENNWNYYMQELLQMSPNVVLNSSNAGSQFPGQYYETPGLVPVASSNIMLCKPGSDCGVAASKVYTVTEDDLGDGDGNFSCGEEQ